MERLVLILLIFGSVYASAQVKIGNNPTTLTPSALLELETSNRGILYPRVNLGATTSALLGDMDPRAAVEGMTVYNLNETITGSANYPAFGKGIYFFDGTGWVFSGVPKGGNNGDFLVKTASGIAWTNLASALPANSLQIKTSNYTPISTDDTILFDVSMASTGLTLQLPPPNTMEGKKLKIGKIDTTENPLLFSIALKLTQSQQIGSLNYPKTFIIQSNGLDWWIVNQM